MESTPEVQQIRSLQKVQFFQAQEMHLHDIGVVTDPNLLPKVRKDRSNLRDINLHSFLHSHI